MMTRDISLALLLLVLTTSNASHAKTNVIEKKISDEWTWFLDYLFLYSKFTIFCEPGCQCKVGMGMKIFDEPRGERISFSSEIDIFTVGIGAIHVKSLSGKAECKARLLMHENPNLIPIVRGQPWNP